jgi:hypothetical protein
VSAPNLYIYFSSFTQSEIACTDASFYYFAQMSDGSRLLSEFGLSPVANYLIVYTPPISNVGSYFIDVFGYL